MTMNTPGNTGNNWPKESDKRQLVLVLTWLGLLPFVLLAPFLGHDIGALLFRGYSLAVLAFLCGTWWATALVVGSVATSERIVVVLTSNLLVIVSVILLAAPIFWSLLPQAGMFLLLAIGERQLRVFADQPTYYKRMRLSVSLIVAGLHLFVWFMLFGL